MDSSTQNSVIPWYRTRWFWGTTLSVQFLLNLSILVFSAHAFDTVIGFLNGVLSSLGSVTIWFILRLTTGMIEDVNLWASAIYLPIFLFILLKTFSKKTVPIIYPAILSFFLLFSLAVTILSFGFYS